MLATKNNFMKKLRYLILLIGLLTVTQAAQAIVVTYYFTYFERGGDVYYGDEKDLRNAYKLHQASMSSLEVLNWGYAKNRSWVYYYGKLVDGADPESFESLGLRYAKDRSRVFYNGKLVKGANRKTFEVVEVDKNNVYGKDKNHIFFKGKITPFDSKSFTYIDKNYVADSSGVYYHYDYHWYNFYGKIEKIEGVNLNSYKIVDDFILSAGKVFLGFIDLNMDAESFELLDKYELHWHGQHHIYDYLVKDKNRASLVLQKHDFDIATFQNLGSYLLCDSTGVYYFDKSEYNNRLRKIDLDPSTVESYVFNKNHRYLIVAKDTVNGYFINSDLGVFNRIRLADMEELKLVEEAENGLVFSHQDELWFTSEYGLVPSSTK